MSEPIRSEGVRGGRVEERLSCLVQNTVLSKFPIDKASLKGQFETFRELLGYPPESDPVTIWAGYDTPMEYIPGSQLYMPHEHTAGLASTVVQARGKDQLDVGRKVDLVQSLATVAGMRKSIFDGLGVEPSGPTSPLSRRQVQHIVLNEITALHKATNNDRDTLLFRMELDDIRTQLRGAWHPGRQQTVGVVAGGVAIVGGLLARRSRQR